MKRIIVLVIILVAAGVFLATLAHAVLYAPDAASDIVPPYFAAASTTPGMLPSRLSIPALGIDANVQHVGLTKSGDMGVPSNFTDTAWYQYGPVPGQWGSAVIDGHVDNGLSLPGVFHRLGELKAGDDIYVETAGGDRLRFVVREVASYPYDQVPVEIVFGKKDAARLNLITCAGSWLKSSKTYDQRLVVYATLSRN